MKPTGITIGTALIRLAFLACVCSCVREDLSDCPPAAPQPLTVMLVMAPGGEDLTPTPKDLKLAVVYLFDSEGSLFTTWTKRNPALNTPYDTSIVLKEGKSYRMVVWVNPIDPFMIRPIYTLAPKSRSDMSNARIELAIPPDGKVTGTIPMLLHGSADGVLTPAERNTPITVSLTLDTNLLHVTMKGLPNDDRTYTLNVSDSDAALDFDNNTLTAPKFVYVSDRVIPNSSGDAVFSQNVVQLDEGRSPQLSVVDSEANTAFPSDGTPAVDLMDLIEQAGLDPDRTNQIHIEIEAPQPGTSVPTIYINGWEVTLDGYVVY